MTFHIYTVGDDGIETVIEDGSKGQKGKPAEWRTRADAEKIVADWKKHATWTGGRHDIKCDFIIKEAAHDPQ